MMLQQTLGAVKIIQRAKKLLRKNLSMREGSTAIGSFTCAEPRYHLAGHHRLRCRTCPSETPLSVRSLAPPLAHPARELFGWRGRSSDGPQRASRRERVSTEVAGTGGHRAGVARRAPPRRASRGTVTGAGELLCQFWDCLKFV
jgi:hypothetical protein